MTSLAPILIPLLLAILYYFWRQVVGLSMQDLFKHSAHEHRRIHKMLAKHPDGGTWHDYQRWMGEAK